MGFKLFIKTQKTQKKTFDPPPLPAQEIQTEKPAFRKGAWA